jgi:hypothetical protein
MTPVPFVRLAEWEPQTYRLVFVWVAFDERLVATGERHGPDNDAGIWRAAEFLPTWSGRLEERGWTWLTPIIERLSEGEDSAAVASDALQEYAARHDGALPETIMWEINLQGFQVER